MQQINESIDTILPFTKVSTSVYSFTDLDGKEVKIDMLDASAFTHDAHYQGIDLIFARGGSYTAANKDLTTGSRNLSAVLATVAHILEQSANDRGADFVTYSAANSEPSRIKLYDRLTRRFARGHYSDATDLLEECREKQLAASSMSTDNFDWRKYRDDPRVDAMDRVRRAVAVGKSKIYLILNRNNGGDKVRKVLEDFLEAAAEAGL